MEEPANRCGSGSDRGLVCASGRTDPTCANTSGSSKAASGQSTHIKWADSAAHEPQARRSAHSRVCLLARISVRAKGLMEQQSGPVIHHHLPSYRCKTQATLGSANARKWTREAVKTSTQPSLLSFVVNEVKLQVALLATSTFRVSI